MKKISIKSLLTTICMLFSASVCAYDFEVDGMYYNILDIEEKTCAVTSGDRLYTGDIVIPEYVTLKGRTFAVKSIGENAFKDCIGLTSFVIPKFIRGVQVGAFNGCTALRKITIEDCENKLELIDLIDYSWNDKRKELFHDCPLEVVYIGRDFEYIFSADGRRPCPSFRNQAKLTDVTIGHYVTRIDGEEFCNCPALANLIIPNSINYIQSGAFANCFGLKSLTIEDGNEILILEYTHYYGSTNPFLNCPIETLYIGRNLSYETKDSPFHKNQTIKSLTIGNSVTKIGNDVFSYCTGIKNLTIGNSVTEIGKNAFSHCTGLTSLTISNSVTMIREYAFYYCTGLTDLILGNSVTYIDTSAFGNCTGISTIYSLNPTPCICNSYFTNRQYLNAQLYVPKGSLSSYQSESPWKYFWNISEFAPTGIKNVTLDDNGKAMIYDLKGNKLKTPQKGLNIINGKKIMMK